MKKIEMANGLKFILPNLSWISSNCSSSQSKFSINFPSSSSSSSSALHALKQQLIETSSRFRISYRYNHRAELEEDENDYSFDDAVALFNKREYYKCHDFLEALWIKSEDPTRTLIHGILQCAVGFHHLFNQNHKGAMLELGEGLCKLRKMNFQSGPFYQFQQDISAVLEFIYRTQIELAACSDEICVAMDQTERSYQLLGGYGAGQLLYSLQNHPMDGMCIVFSPRPYGCGEPPRVKLPILEATQQHLTAHGS